MTKETVRKMSGMDDFWSCVGQNRGQIVEEYTPQTPRRAEGNCAKICDGLTLTVDRSDGRWLIRDRRGNAVSSGHRGNPIPSPIEAARLTRGTNA